MVPSGWRTQEVLQAYQVCWFEDLNPLFYHVKVTDLWFNSYAFTQLASLADHIKKKQCISWTLYLKKSPYSECFIISSFYVWKSPDLLFTSHECEEVWGFFSKKIAIKTWTFISQGCCKINKVDIKQALVKQFLNILGVGGI